MGCHADHDEIAVDDVAFAGPDALDMGRADESADVASGVDHDAVAHVEVPIDGTDLAPEDRLVRDVG